MSRVRTRFAPSPTGFMHLGSLRTALYAYLFAKKHGGTFILRIEDTDQERFVPGATEVIYDTLHECGIIWDEGPDVGGDFGPYIQSERKATYLPYALQLVEGGHAYHCFCTKGDIERAKEEASAAGRVYKYDKRCRDLPRTEVGRRLASGESSVIRFDTPAVGETPFDDLVFGRIVTPNDTLDDMILIKADGMPTYNFANVIDDHLMGITHVMRGKEYLSSTPKYNLIYRALGWDIPQYIHLPEILRDMHHKLSKRDGDAYYTDFIEKGYLKEALINHLVLVGWNPGDNREFLTMPELIEAFDASGISKSSALFDAEKLRWFNAEYIRRLTPEVYAGYAAPWLDKALGAGRFDRGLLCALLQPRTEVFSELPGMVDFLVERPTIDPALYIHKKSKCDADIARRALALLPPVLAAQTAWDGPALYGALNRLAEHEGLKNAQLFWPMRVALSGKASTPGGATDLAALLGREESLIRLHSAAVGLGA